MSEVSREPMALKLPRPAGELTSLAERVYRHLREQIVTWVSKPGDPISEKVLSETLGVSRTPVREALARLAADRLVDIYPQRGTFVAPLRLRDLECSQFMREKLEIGLVQRVTQLPDRAELVARMRAEVDLQRTFARIKDEPRFYRSDEDFHRLIASAAGLPGVWEEIARVKVYVDRARHLALATVENDVRTIAAQHTAIIDAVEAGDPQRAGMAMQVHLRRILKFIGRMAEITPEYFEDPDAVAAGRGFLLNPDAESLASATAPPAD